MKAQEEVMIDAFIMLHTIINPPAAPYQSSPWEYTVAMAILATILGVLHGLQDARNIRKSQQT